MGNINASIDLRRDGRIAIVIADNPPVNALKHEVRAGLVEALRQAGDDDGVEAVVIACAGRTFFAGADISEFGKPPQAPSLGEVIAAIEAMAKPVVAALHGTALGRRLRAGARLPFPGRRGGGADRPARSQARPVARRRRDPAPAAPHRPGKGAADDRHRRAGRGGGSAGRRHRRRDRRGRSDRGGDRLCPPDGRRTPAVAAHSRPRRQADRRGLCRCRGDPDPAAARPRGARRLRRGGAQRHRPALRRRAAARKRAVPDSSSPATSRRRSGTSSSPSARRQKCRTSRPRQSRARSRGPR